MTWGEAQSVIQLAVALNAIYLALHEIRNPYVRNEQAALNEQSSEWKKLTGAPQIGAAINDNYSQLTTAIADFEKSDSNLGVLCLCTVVVYVFLLVISAFYYQEALISPWNFLICIAGFIPIFLAILLNINLVLNLQGSVAQKRDLIDGMFAEHKGKQAQPAAAPLPLKEPSV